MSTSRRSPFAPVSRAVLLALFLCSSAWAQGVDNDQDAATDESADLDKIVVTGSRIKRSEIEGAQPVIVIDQEQMNERGYTTVYEALSDLTVNNGYKYEGAEAALFTPDVQTLNLRGFGVGTTLTLINGRRLTNYPAAYQSNATVFSFGSIPVAAVDRIEILATGASAIYGSDAVAGVVNIILKDYIDETTVNVLWGTPTETKSTRDDLRLQVTTGKTFDKGSLTFTGEYANRDSILGKHYNKYDDQADDYPYGTGYYNRSILTLDWFRNAFGIYPYYRDPADIFGTSGDAACSQSGGGQAYAYRPPIAGMYCGDPGQGVPEVNFQNEKESISLYLNGTLEIGDKGTELFTDLLYYNSESSSNNNTVWIFEDVLDITKPDSVGYGFYDWYLAQRGFNEQELGMKLEESFEDEAYSVMAGIRGVLADVHDYELSVNYSKYDYKSQRPWLKWRETIDTFLGTWWGVGFFGDDWWSGGTAPWDDLSFGVGDPNNLYGAPTSDVLNAIGMQHYGNESEDLYLQYVMNGDLFEMKSGPVAYALVVEYEDQKIKYVPDELIKQAPPTTDANGDPIYGLTGSGWYRLTGYDGDGDRQRWSVGGELRIPLHPTLMLNLAARYDEYDSTSTSFGGDLTPSATLEWRPTANLLVRAGYTESFRAPDMAQVFVRTGFFTGGYDYVSCYEQYVWLNGSDAGFDIGDCDSTSIFARRVGGQDIGLEPLDAEKGDSKWLGVSWDITEDFNITVDYTEMHLTQRTLQQSTQGLLNDEYDCYIGNEPSNVSCDDIGNQIVRGIDPLTGLSYIENFYVTSINQYQEDASFIDVRVIYNLDTKIGQFTFNGDYNNMLDHTRKLTADSEEVDLKSDPIAGGWDFRSSFTGSLTWSYEDISATVTGIYRGATTVWNPYLSGRVTGENYYDSGNWWVDPYLTWNFTASYYWTSDFMTRLRIVNVFDEDPPFDDTFQPYEQPWYNYFVYPGAGIGRYAALELSYTF